MTDLFVIVMPLSFFCFPPSPPLTCCLESSLNDPHQWERMVRCVLVMTPSASLAISEHIRQGLLLEGDKDDDDDDTTDETSNLLSPRTALHLDMDEIDLDNDEDFILKGLPKHPLYKTLSYRLFLLCTRELRQQNNKNDPFVKRKPNNFESLLIPAKEFGLEEDFPLPAVPPAPTKLHALGIRRWFREAGNQGVLTLLGLRHTVGSDPRGLFPPSWKALLSAANQSNRPDHVLSVAARARAKHAHRGGSQQFFGVARGSQANQNAAARDIIANLLHNAVWINIHTFSGTNGRPALEVRVVSGYGTRWVADWSDPLHPTDIEFRGFLEPQMEDGHLKGWRHG